ncbi:hypothetical protein K1719_024657 [Acacia pycnantha]|nr:hypothetical protein K1719_024657 [Acacia pycnantha]
MPNRAIQARVLKSLNYRDGFIGDQLVSSYISLGFADDAEKLFDEIPHRDMVFWNSLIFGFFKRRRPNSMVVICTQNGIPDGAFQHLNMMKYNSIRMKRLLSSRNSLSEEEEKKESFFARRISRLLDQEASLPTSYTEIYAFLAPLTSGRVTIAVGAVYVSKISLAIAIRYALTRRAFSMTPNGPEVLLLDYPIHQHRLMPLLAANDLKLIYMKRTPESNKTIHVVSSAYKAIFTWNNVRILQECREAYGGQGYKTEYHVGHLKGEYDVQSTFEGENHVLMQ